MILFKYTKKTTNSGQKCLNLIFIFIFFAIFDKSIWDLSDDSIGMIYFTFSFISDFSPFIFAFFFIFLSIFLFILGLYVVWMFCSILSIIKFKRLKLESNSTKIDKFCLNSAFYFIGNHWSNKCLIFFNTFLLKKIINSFCR